MSARDRLALMIVAAAALLGAMWFMVVAPERKQAAKAGADLAQAQNTRESALASERTAEQAQSSFNANAVTIGQLQRAVPVSSDVSPLLDALESTARADGVDFRSLSSSTTGGSAGQSASRPPSASGPVAGPTSGATGAVSTANASSQAAANASPGAGPAPSPSAAAAAASPAAAASTFPPQSFTMTVAGDFTHVQHFLDTVNRWTSVKGRNVTVSGRLLSLQSVSLSNGTGGAAASASPAASPAAGSGSGSMSASITVSVYTLPVGEAGPAALLRQLAPSATAPVASSRPAPVAAAHPAPGVHPGSPTHVPAPPTAAVGVSR